MDNNPFQISVEGDPRLSEDSYSNLKMDKVWRFLFADPQQNFFIHFDNHLNYEHQKACAEFILGCIQQDNVLNKAQIDLLQESADNDVREVIAIFVGAIKKIADYFPDVVSVSELSDNENKDTLEE